MPKCEKKICEKSQSAMKVEQTQKIAIKNQEGTWIRPYAIIIQSNSSHAENQFEIKCSHFALQKFKGQNKLKLTITTIELWYIKLVF